METLGTLRKHTQRIRLNARQHRQRPHQHTRTHLIEGVCARSVQTKSQSFEGQRHLPANTTIDPIRRENECNRSVNGERMPKNVFLSLLTRRRIYLLIDYGIWKSNFPQRPISRLAAARHKLSHVPASVTIRWRHNRECKQNHKVSSSFRLNVFEPISNQSQWIPRPMKQVICREPTHCWAHSISNGI